MFKILELVGYKRYVLVTKVFQKEVIFWIGLETADIFRAAFFMCNGHGLCEIQFRKNGDRIATFLITGKDMDKLAKLTVRARPKSIPCSSENC